MPCFQSFKGFSVVPIYGASGSGTSTLGKKISGYRCYGLTADENYLLVCEYGENGKDPEIVVFRRRY
jgi:hypothetical protein